MKEISYETKGLKAITPCPNGVEKRDSRGNKRVVKVGSSGCIICHYHEATIPRRAVLCNHPNNEQEA